MRGGLVLWQPPVGLRLSDCAFARPDSCRGESFTAKSRRLACFTMEARREREVANAGERAQGLGSTAAQELTLAMGMARRLKQGMHDLWHEESGFGMLHERARPLAWIAEGFGWGPLLSPLAPR